MRPFGECPNPLFLAPHPLFLGGKSSHFSTFFVFFYIDFVFFFMIFAYFPIILSNFLLAQTHIGRFREFAQGRTFRLTKGDLTGMSLILYCGLFFMLFRYAMNDVGDDAPYHEAVGLVDTDGSVGLVPGNEPAEGSAFVDLNCLMVNSPSTKAMTKLPLDGSIWRSTMARSPSRMPAPVMLSPDMRT